MKRYTSSSSISKRRGVGRGSENALADFFKEQM